MSSHEYSLCIFLVMSIYAVVCMDAVNLTASELPDKLKTVPSLNPASVVLKPAVDSLLPLTLLSSFPEDLEISEYCSEVLHVFGQRYVDYVKCLVPAARPVKVCQNCFSSYGRLVESYTNISNQVRAEHTAVSCVYSSQWSDGQRQGLATAQSVTSLVMRLSADVNIEETLKLLPALCLGSTINIDTCDSSEVSPHD